MQRHDLEVRDITRAGRPLIQERLRDSRNRRLTPVHIWYTAGNGSGPRQVCKVRIRHP